MDSRRQTNASSRGSQPKIVSSAPKLSLLWINNWSSLLIHSSFLCNKDISSLLLISADSVNHLLKNSWNLAKLQWQHVALVCGAFWWIRYFLILYQNRADWPECEGLIFLNILGQILKQTLDPPRVGEEEGGTCGMDMTAWSTRMRRLQVGAMNYRNKMHLLQAVKKFKSISGQGFPGPIGEYGRSLFWIFDPIHYFRKDPPKSQNPKRQF